MIITVYKNYKRALIFWKKISIMLIGCISNGFRMDTKTTACPFHSECVGQQLVRLETGPECCLIPTAVSLYQMPESVFPCVNSIWTLHMDSRQRENMREKRRDKYHQRTITSYEEEVGWPKCQCSCLWISHHVTGQT